MPPVRCRRGVEGLPFKLLITSIIMAVVLPIGYAAFSGYDEGVLRSRVSLELRHLADAIEEVGTGPGNVRTISVDLSDSALSKVDYVHIGGAPGTGKDMLIRYSVEGETSNIVLQGVHAATAEGEALDLVGGEYRIRLESVTLDGDTVVLLETIP